jgi:Uma2 family endonuclease
MLLELNRLEIPIGQKLLLKNINWSEFEQILKELGEHRTSKLAYYHHVLEIMTPFPEHESNKLFISNFIEILLEELEIDFYPLGSTTFKSEFMQYGIEPDNCFYIENEAKIRGKDRIDLTIDPPPDLALEIDVTSRTHPEIYLQLGVPELWQFEKGNLIIKILENNQYKTVAFSPHFPDFPLKENIPLFLKRVKTEGRNKTMKAFRSWVKEMNK